MVTPIIGPTVTTSGGTTGSMRSYWRREGYKQSKPFDRVLAYDYRRCDLNRLFPGTGNTYDAFGLAAGYDMLAQLDSWRPEVHIRNLLYDRFKEKMAGNAQLGVGLVELGKSYGMVSARALQLVQFGRHLKAGRFGDAAHVLGLSKVPKGVSRKKQLSSNYLEFHFGWSPMVADMYNAIDVLQNPLRAVWVRATALERLGRLDLETPVSFSDKPVAYPQNATQYSWRYWRGDRRAACGAQVAVTNPNLWLANQLGLINPASIAWELIPFSFVADWFVNVGQCLDSFTDYYGLTLSKEWTTVTYRGVAHSYYFARYKWMENGSWVWGGGLFGDRQGSFIHTRRQVGLPKPTFVVKPFKAWGLRRAAAAVSLLVLQLEGIRARR